MRSAVSALALLLVFQADPTARAGDAFEQNRKLGRGVNIIGYDPIWRSMEQGRFKEKHFRLLKEAGFNSVRINLHPFRRMEPAKDLVVPEAWFTTLDWALKHCREQKLVAILDLHEFTAMGADAEGNKKKFLAFWRQMAARYQAAPAEVLFEILNEPNKELGAARWNEYLLEALSIIREKNPDRTVIIGPANWNAIGFLKELQLPEQDRNIIVTVHYYTPMEFTHQGAPWTDHKDKQGVEWTGSEGEIKVLDADFDKAAAWAKEHDRPIFLGEFGAYDKGPMPSRARYTAAVARAAEKRGWSWAYWQFDSDFILYDLKRDAWVNPILRALIPQ
jgi:endoglucanase